MDTKGVDPWDKGDGVRLALVFLASATLATLYIWNLAPRGEDYVKLRYYYGTVAPMVGGMRPFHPHGVFYGIYASLAYVFLRFFMGGSAALICLAFMLTSPFQLHNLIPAPRRDFIKAPFVFAVMCMVVSGAWASRTKMQLLGLSVLAGGIIGYGLRYRADLLAFVPLYLGFHLLFFRTRSGGVRTHLLAAASFLLTLLIFLQNLRPAFCWTLALGLLLLLVFQAERIEGLTRRHFRLLLLALAFVGALLHKSAPAGYPWAGLTALEGFMKPFDTLLGVKGATYDWGTILTDEYVQALSYAKAALNPSCCCFERDSFVQTVYRDLLSILTNFPADILVRALAATRRILNVPFTYTAVPMGLENTFLEPIYRVRAGLLEPLNGLGVVIAFLAAGLMRTRNLRQALLWPILVVALGGYTILFFQGRHYFHLELLAWSALGSLGQSLFSGLLRSRGSVQTGEPPHTTGPEPSRLFIGGKLTLLAASLFVFYGFRYWQVAHLRSWFGNLSTQPTRPLPVERHPQEEGVVFEVPAGVLRQPPDCRPDFDKQFPTAGLTSDFRVSSEYLAATFGGDDCEAPFITPLFQFEEGSYRADFSTSVLMDLTRSKDRVVRYYFPALAWDSPSHGATWFRGVMLPASQERCFLDISRVDHPETFPMPIPVLLYNPLAGGDLTQRLEEDPPGLMAMPHGQQVPRLPLDDPSFHAVLPDQVIFRSKIASFTDGRWRFSGYADSFHLPDPPVSVASAAYPYVRWKKVHLDTDLLATGKSWQQKGNTLFLQGRLDAGGFSLILIGDGNETASVDVTRPGEFTVLLQAPADDHYTVGLVNNLDGPTSIENRFVLTRFGWLNRGRKEVPQESRTD